MRGILNIAINDLRVFTKNMENLIFLLLVPLVLTFIIGYVNGGGFEGPSQLRVDFFDNDNSELSVQFAQSLREANDSIVLCPADDEDGSCGLGDESEDFNLERATERAQTSDTLAVIEIPAGFGESVQNFEPVQIVYLSNEDFTAPGYIRQAVDAAVLRVNGAVIASRVGTYMAENIEGATSDDSFTQGVYDRAAAIWEDNPVGVTYELTEAEANTHLQAGMAQSVPGMGSMFVMFTVFGGMMALILERKQETLQRLAVMPVSKTQILGGKMLGRFILGLLQFLVVFATGVVMSVNFGSDPLAIVLLMVSYVLAITAISFAVGSRLENEQQASGLALLLMMILAPLGGAWWPLNMPGYPEFMLYGGHISPVAWIMDGFNKLTFAGGSLADIEVWGSIGVLLAMALVFFAIAVRLFKYE